MTDTPQITLHVRSTTDLVEVVPTLLGFHPEDSLVLIAIVDGTIAVTARVDLPCEGAGTVEGLRAVWRRFPTADLVGIAFSDDPARAWFALDEFDHSVPPGLGRLLVHADGAHWFGAPHAHGVPYDGLGSVHLAEATYRGRAVRGSRDELRALVEPGCTPAEVTASLDRVARRAAGMADLVRDGLALVEAHDAAPGDLDLDDATLLCLASHDPGFLDAALLSTVRENAEQRLSLWLQVVRGSVPNCAGYALAAAGLAAWVSGEGALQVVCLEAAVGRRGPQVWFDFLDGVNAEAVEPSRWEALRAAFLADAALDDALG